MHAEGPQGKHQGRHRGTPAAEARKAALLAQQLASFYRIVTGRLGAQQLEALLSMSKTTCDAATAEAVGLLSLHAVQAS